MSQPLRHRQKKALQHLLDLLRESGHGHAAQPAVMDTESADAKNPIP
jgi:uncharacterized protein YidB (DUF937 family)